AGEIDEFQSEQHFLHADGRQVPGRFSASVTTGLEDRSFACVLEADEAGGRGASRTRRNGGETHAVLDDFFDGVIAIDGNGCIVSFNQAARSLFGYEPREVLGREAGRITARPFR